MSAQDKRPNPNCIMLLCKDMAASAQFYRDQLGFDMAESWPSPEAPLWASMRMADQVIMIGAAMEPEGDHAKADPEGTVLMKEMIADFNSGTPGAGASFYINIPDVDGYHAGLLEKGVAVKSSPKTQFYGLREFQVCDPDGYRLMMYSYVTMDSCQSCGMPIADKAPGDIYCDYCTDDAGNLQSYEAILEGTIQGYFMGMQGMERAEAEVAAKEHLSKMPTWMCMNS